jgi:hypothetical protein
LFSVLIVSKPLFEKLASRRHSQQLLQKHILISQHRPLEWENNNSNLMPSNNSKLNDAYYSPPWMQTSSTSSLEELQIELEPHLQAMSYALPHPSQHFANEDITVDHFPFSVHNLFQDLDGMMPVFDQGNTPFY